MGRIRTVKPDLFKHEELAEAEFATGLPLRLAFIGLFTQADREGRFLWRPRALKTDILPYDQTDFGVVLDALATWGFVTRYSVDGREIGCIPSFLRHQVINHREAASVLPQQPEKTVEFNASSSNAARVPGTPGHAQGEGKGREGKGTIEPDGSILSEPAVADRSKPKAARKKGQAYTAEYEALWKAYPSTVGQSKMDGFKAWQKLSQDQQAQAFAALPAYAALLKKNPERAVKHVQGYLSGRMFESFGASVSELETPALWEKRLAHSRTAGQWAAYKWGPMPGQPGCRAPAHLLQPGDGDGWTEARAA